jgi:hypothetical protein
MFYHSKVVNWTRALGIGAIFAIFVGTAASQNAPETYSYRYRLTISIETDGQTHTGSSVIEVIWRRRPDFGNGVGYLPEIRGQGVFTDLGSHGAIVAALHTGGASGNSRNGPWNAEWIAPRAFHMSITPELPDLRMEGRRELTPDNMPRLIWFSDPADPMTARPIAPAEFTASLGPGARLVSADVEITDDPIVIDIDKKLPWYPELANRQRSQGVLIHPASFDLIYSMFVGAAT